MTGAALLLDTHVMLWWSAGRSMAKGARQAIASAQLVYVSAASAWEASMKRAMGRLDFAGSFEAAVKTCDFMPLSISFIHVERTAELPRHHRDPFDRILVAQALCENLTLVTRDEALMKYRVPLIRA